MPTYKNVSKVAITIKNEDGFDMTVNPGQTFISKVSHNNKELEEIDRFPYYSPIVKETKDISGADGDVVEVPVFSTANVWEIINNSSASIELHYDDIEAEGLTIFSGSSIKITDPSVKEVDKFVLKLNGTVEANTVIINQFR